MPFCDAHGWRWEPGQGPSPCVGETISLFLACGVLLYTIPLTKDVLHPFQRAAAAGSTAARIHAVQVSLAIVQALIALTGGMLSARPRGMLCGALVLHSLAWPAAWFTSATAMQRSPDCSKGLLWFWCCALVLNSVVLSSLRHASEVSGRHLPAEIGCLSWMSFFGIALLVVLQLAKPELHDTEGVYVRVVGREGVMPSTAANDGGWQAFWAGGGDGFGATATVADIARRKKGWFCLGGRRGAEDGYEEGGAWPISGGASRTTDRGTLNESLLGTIGFEERAAGAGASPAKAKGLWSGGSAQHVARSSGGCFQRAGGFLCSVVGRKNKATSSLSEATTATAAAQQEEGMVGARAGAGWLQRQDSPFERKLRKGGDTSAAGSGTRVRAQQPLGGGGGGSSSSYSGGPSIGARAPPQVAAPVFSVAVTRWRLVSTDGVPLAHGSSRDTSWTDHGTTHDRPRAMSSSSVRTAILSGAGDAIEDRPYDRFERSSPSAAAAAAAADLKSVGEDDGAGAAGATHEPPRVQFELLVRASGRGEMDWWGHGDPEAAALPPGPAGLHSHGFGGAAGATASTPGSGDWRVWRSAADTLALYDALALRFGQEFCGRVARPEFVTVTISPLASSGRRAAEGDGGPRSPTPSLGSPALAFEPAAPHRVDILRDAKTVGAFLRSLLGLRQFLSTAVMDYLAQPPPAAPPAEGFSEDGLRDYSVQGNGGSENGSDSGYSTADDLLEEETGSRQGTEAQRKNASRRRKTFAPDAAGGGPSAAGEAVAVAALASDYGSWLKRLAVRLRRSTPAGERFVRLRCISPAVTGAQVVWWLVREEVCNGDRASAVRLGQDMVSHRLMTPLCAGYDRPRDDDDAAAAAAGDRASSESRRDPSRSFDDAVGWLFAFAGDALRDPFAPPPPTQVAVMTNTGVDVRVTGWTETSDEDGTHVSFVVHTHVEATQEAWECPRRYREFTQLRKRLLRLGIDIPTVATRSRDAGRAGVGGGGGGGGGGAGGGVGGVVSPELPKKTWRANKFDSDHLETRRAALEAYLQAAVKAALAAPHLSGHLVMRFLDPDESNLRILTEQRQQQQQQQRSRNPFASSRTPSSPSPRGAPRGAGGGGARRRGGSIGGSVGVGEASGVAPRESVGKRLEEDRAEAEDFDTLTDSLGGFG
ncbi:unnamed protein product [Scytosiphon promiscuus]